MSVLRTFCAALLVALAGTAGAQEIDPTFAGRWRVTAAAPAPWARDNPNRPLARTGIIFLDDRMVGQGALSCVNARYEVTVVPPQGLFQGALGDRADEAAERLGLSGDITTLRVNCDTGSFDFHHRGGTDLLFAYNNVIYTLNRPSDPEVPAEDAAFIKPAEASFDCNAARSTAEQLICSSERTSRADFAMAREYRRLSSELSPRNAEALRTAQRGWLAFTRSFCRADRAMPQEDSERLEAARCLGEETEQQAGFYEGLRVVSAGGLRIEPHVRVTSDPRRMLLDIDAVPNVVSTPPRPALQALIDRRTRRPALSARLPGGGPLQTSIRDYTVDRIDDRIVSITLTTRVETGTRVPAQLTSINWDVRRNRPLELTSLFRPDAAWQAVVLETLEREAESHLPDTAREAALREMREIDRWSFLNDRAIVRFSVAVQPLVGDPAAGIEVMARQLTSHLRPDAPWRPAE